ncbi:MAG: hypothetical protein II348_01160 [Clostridia bacterium]|nr:hypothetical protein [Clostridia bacterium]
MAKKYRGLYLYTDQRPLLELIPANEFKGFILGLIDYVDNGEQPKPLKSARARNVQEAFMLNLNRSRINSANGAIGAEVTNNLYGERIIKKIADGKTDESADGLNETESNKREKNNSITKERVPERSPPREHRCGYGTHNNVLLTEREKNAIESEHGIPQAYIDHFSNALKIKGYQYASHYSAILEWWERDKTSPRWQSETQQQNGSFDTDDFFAAAVRKSLGEDFVSFESENDG